MADQCQVLSSSEFSEIRDWIESHGNTWPEHVRSSFNRLLSTYMQLAKGKRQQKELLYEQRQAMGFIRKSEKGSLDEKKSDGA